MATSTRALLSSKVAVGQNDLFGLAVNAETSEDEVKDYSANVPPWSEKERLAFEKLQFRLVHSQ
jgi:DNA polymerase-3 subunit alpha